MYSGSRAKHSHTFWESVNVCADRAESVFVCQMWTIHSKWRVTRDVRPGNWSGQLLHTENSGFSATGHLLFKLHVIQIIVVNLKRRYTSLWVWLNLPPLLIWKHGLKFHSFHGLVVYMQYHHQKSGLTWCCIIYLFMFVAAELSWHSKHHSKFSSLVLPG